VFRRHETIPGNGSTSPKPHIPQRLTQSAQMATDAGKVITASGQRRTRRGFGRRGPAAAWGLGEMVVRGEHGVLLAGRFLGAGVGFRTSQRTARSYPAGYDPEDVKAVFGG
jgi:hypothetical protein